jgi:anhydro-N-acetylmuramic acid kinase
MAQCEQLLVCGGGAYNTYLMELLALDLPGCEVATTQSTGLPPMQVEACAFAWLAAQAICGRTGNLPAVTGARGARVLGAIYPA